MAFQPTKARVSAMQRVYELQEATQREGSTS